MFTHYHRLSSRRRRLLPKGPPPARYGHNDGRNHWAKMPLGFPVTKPPPEGKAQRQPPFVGAGSIKKNNHFDRDTGLADLPEKLFGGPKIRIAATARPLHRRAPLVCKGDMEFLTL